MKIKACRTLARTYGCMTAVGVYHRSSDYLLNSQYIFEDWLFRVYTAVSMVRSETGLSRGKHEAATEEKNTPHWTMQDRNPSNAMVVPIPLYVVCHKAVFIYYLPNKGFTGITFCMVRI